MDKKKPIKRDPNLQPLSRDHHHTLLLCWKIRKGFSKNIEVGRIKAYTDWFFENHVLPHFKIEEKYLFPVLGEEDAMVKKALAEHRRLKRLFREEKDVEKSLNLIEEELDQHVRFEERELFGRIQAAATAEQLAFIKQHHTEAQFEENTRDEFWN
ncbi:cation-binding protein [Christiangramia fulva]|uniref:Cation-binding protein n=1 Tax=Christiangramia fulva TaxID=2126553 RepID=A0A2R3Z980_9FLAO|nr:hemerythrin domain-containing protein [Christiangramia fulva]AVR46816.1 cation-binding protein [Christiangramia fulva]